jgi:hypothetical protein
MNKFYVYAHHKLMKNIPVYIGKGNNRRAYSKANRNRWWRNIVNKHGYRVQILADHWYLKEVLETGEKSCLVSVM